MGVRSETFINSYYTNFSEKLPFWVRKLGKIENKSSSSKNNSSVEFRQTCFLELIFPMEYILVKTFLSRRFVYLTIKINYMKLMFNLNVFNLNFDLLKILLINFFEFVNLNNFPVFQNRSPSFYLKYSRYCLLLFINNIIWVHVWSSRIN